MKQTLYSDIDLIIFHKDYQIHERLEFLSHTCQSEV